MVFHMERIGILGGTFDPIHIGHLLIAEQAYNKFKLDKIIFMPAGIPPHKGNNEISHAKHRLEMLKIAIKNNSHFSFSTWEMDNGGKSFTCKTLKYIKDLKIARDVYFIIGTDSLLDIFNWKDSDYLLEYGRFIVARRPNFPIELIYDDERYKNYLSNIYVMDTMLIDISSSRIRETVNKGDSIKYQTTEEVIDYIKRNDLYRGG
jgi:nicotinate-nucleotide adenylyltransferase